MGFVEINDDVIWAKHVHEDPELQRRIVDAPQGTVIRLEIDGLLCDWIKMKDDPSGRPTNGIRPTKTSLKAWRDIRKRKWGTLLRVTAPETRQRPTNGLDLTFPGVPPTGLEKSLPQLVEPDERIVRYGLSVGMVQAPFFELEKSLPIATPKPLLDRIAVSRQLATYGYFCYEFHAVSTFWSISCIEMALKLKFREVNPGPFRLVRKTKDGTEETTEVAITFLEKRLRERWRLPEMKGFDYSFRAFLAWAFRVGLLPDDLPIPVQEILNAFNNRFATEIFFDRALKEGLIGPNPTLGELQACWAGLTEKQREHYSFKSSGVLVEELPRFRNDMAHPQSWNFVTVPRSAVNAYALLVDIVSRLWPTPSDLTSATNP